MISRFSLLSFLCVCCIVAPTAAGAQQHVPLSTQASIGLRSGAGGTYVNRGGLMADLGLTTPIRGLPAGTLIGGLNLGMQGSVMKSWEPCVPDAEGRCAPDFPAFFSAGAALGVQAGSAETASLRIAAGPAYHQSFSGGAAVGLQGQLDLATQQFLPAAVVVSVRRTLLPSLRGEGFTITSIALGVRVH